MASAAASASTSAPAPPPQPSSADPAVHQLEVACAELKSLHESRAVYEKRGAIFFRTTVKAAAKSQRQELEVSAISAITSQFVNYIDHRYEITRIVSLFERSFSMALSAACYQPTVQCQWRESSHHGTSEILGRASPYLQGDSNVACLGVRRTSSLARSQNYHCVSARQEATSHDCVKFLSPALWPSNRRGFARAPLALPSPEVEGDVKEGTPWEGAIVFRRSAVQSRFDYSTTLERLGLSRFSSEKAMALATEMGLEKSEVDGVIGTPVQVSVDFKKEGRDFRLDGIIRTSLALLCNRCLAPVAERVYASFNLLLTEAPVLEPTQHNLGVVLGDNVNIWKAEADDDAQAELDIDLDDKIHFPRDQKEVDLSKYLRDTIHLEIPAKSLCDSGCPGLCFGCGVNLNSSACLCGKHKKKRSAVDMEEILGLNRNKAIWSPLEQLKKQLEEQENRADDPQS